MVLPGIHGDMPAAWPAGGRRPLIQGERKTEAQYARPSSADESLPDTERLGLLDDLELSRRQFEVLIVLNGAVGTLC